MASLHDELLGESKGGACKVCTFLARLDPASRAEWQREIAMPITDITHTAIVVALKRRNISIEEASVRRHRANHV
jgi:hypothetical protein